MFRLQEKENQPTNKSKNKQDKNKMADLSPNISVITLNVNGLNIPIKRLVEWTKKMTQLYAIYKKCTSDKM